MPDNNESQKLVDRVEVESLSDDDLDSVAGGTLTDQVVDGPVNSGSGKCIENSGTGTCS